MTFSEKISALRKQKGWSQEELAEKLMVTRQAVSKWESAQSMPDLDKLVQLSEALGVSTDYLLKDEQMQSAPAPAAAEQAAKLSEEKKLHVIPSRSVPEGISAMFCYEHDADPDEMEAAMKDAIQQVDTATVTFAVRDTSIGDKQIKEGNILGKLKEEIEVVAEDVMEGTKEL